VKTLRQLALMKEEDRRSLLRSISDDQYKDVMKVLSNMPSLKMTVTTEVVDDEEQHVVTAGAIITVTILIKRETLAKITTDSFISTEEDEDLDPEDAELLDDEDEEKDESTAAAEKKEEKEEEEEKKKGPAWKKPQQKKKSKKGGPKPKSKPKQKSKDVAQTAKQNGDAEKPEDGHKSMSQQKLHLRKNEGDSGSDSDGEDSGSDDSVSEEGSADRGGAASEGGRERGGTTVNSEEEDEDQEWARFQNKLNKREKALEGKSKVSHSVHCPYFTDDKQEYWWVYICDRKTHSLVTPPYHLTGLVNQEEVELKFTAPGKPGHYGFTVVIRSDSYLGLDLLEDIKLDVKEARAAPTEHPQWEFEDDDEEETKEEESQESEFATDDDYDEDSD